MKQILTLLLLLGCITNCRAKYGYMKSGIDGKPGIDGQNGSTGQNGSNGISGTNCTVQQTETGAVITCGDTAAVLQHGHSPLSTYVCHVPPGNPLKQHTLYLPENAVEAHLGHGDYEGECLD